MPSVHLHWLVSAALVGNASRAVAASGRSCTEGWGSCPSSCVLSGSNPSPDCLHFYCSCNTDVHFLLPKCPICPFLRPILHDRPDGRFSCEPVGDRTVLLCPAPTDGGKPHPYPIHCAPAKFLSYASSQCEVPLFDGLTPKDSAGNPPEPVQSPQYFVLPEIQVTLNNTSRSSVLP